MAIAFLKRSFGSDSHTAPMTASAFAQQQSQLNAKIADRRILLYKLIGVASAMFATNVSVALALRPQGEPLLDLYISLGLLSLMIFASFLAIVSHHDLKPVSSLYGVGGQQGVYPGNVNPHRYCYNILRRDDELQYQLVGVSVVFLIFGVVLLVFGLIFGIVEHDRGMFDTFVGWLMLSGGGFPVVWMYFAATRRFVKQRNPTPDKARDLGIVA